MDDRARILQALTPELAKQADRLLKYKDGHLIEVDISVGIHLDMTPERGTVEDHTFHVVTAFTMFVENKQDEFIADDRHVKVEQYGDVEDKVIHEEQYPNDWPEE